MEDNKAWLESVRENFEIAIAEGDYPLVKDIIADVRNEGFDTEAKEMDRLLKEETLGTFIHESDAKTWI